MKNYLNKHWLRPYWRGNELDEWLAAQEAAGWRLERVGFFRRFVFICAFLCFFITGFCLIRLAFA